MARTFAAASSQYLYNNTSVVAWYDGVTVMCRVRPTSAAPAATRVAFGFGYSGSNTPIFMFGQLITTGLAFAQIRDDAAGDTGVISGGSALAANAWTSLGVGSNGSNEHELYVAGVSVATNTTALGATSSNRTAIGAILRAAAGVYWDGGISEVAIWSNKLADGAHAEFHAGADVRTISPSTQVCYWTINGKASPEKNMLGATDMTLSGTPAATDHPRIVRRRPMRWPQIAPAGAPPSYVSRLALLGAG